MNFASLFNQFRSQSNYGLNQLLQQPGLSMGRLLDQDSFSNEYKSNNPKLAQFMKYDKYAELIEFITVVGSGDDKKRSYKYPLNASDFLCIDNWQALEFILPEKPIYEEKKVYETTTEDIQMEVEVPQQPQTTPKVEANQQNDEKVAADEEKPEPKKEQQQLIEQKTNQPEQSKEQSTEGQKSVENEPQAIEKKNEKKYRKIVVQNEKTVEKIQKRELPPLITKILAYFDNEVNYTLAGYVSKVLNFLFTKKPVELMKYIFQNGKTTKILNHAESRSVGDFIIKVITYESSSYLEQRCLFFKKLLQRLSVVSEVYLMSNLSAYVCEIIQKISANLKGNNKIPQFAFVFFSLQTITEVIKNIMSDEENVSVYNSPIIFVFLTSIPFDLPEDQQKRSAFKSLLQHFIDKSCSKLQVSSESRSRLGVGRMKIIEILRFILKENIMNVREIIGNSTIFLPTLFTLMKEYSMNNLLHNEIIKILDIALSQNQSSPLSKMLVKDDVLLNFLVEQANKDLNIRTGNSVYKTRKGYAAHLINLFIKLREMNQKNANIKAIASNQKFLNLYQIFVEKENYKTSSNLAGYAMKKQKKHEIMFQKEDIINSHITFLQKCPASVFDIVPEHINIEHPDLVEDLVKQLEQKIQQKTEQPQMVIMKNDIQELTNEKAPGVMQIEEQSRHNDFWVKHLDYNVDDLMAAL